MAMWRCPHCGTPQAETARCWVCRRSSTSCATCRHFRASVAAKMGYCGLDRQRQPLSGNEIRACWEASREPAESPSMPTASAAASRTPVPRRDFVEVVSSAAERPSSGKRRPAGDRDRGALTEDQGEPVAAPVVAPPRWSLWEDAEG